MRHQIRDRDDYGRNVILASRIGPLTLGGQILFLSVLHDRVESSGDLLFDTGREVELTGLAGTQRVFEAMWS